MGKINYNPNLPPNDALTPSEIEARAARRNEETRHLAEQAYLTGNVPPSAAGRAADHSSITRQTAEAKKARRDAAHWFKAALFGINSEEDDD